MVKILKAYERESQVTVGETDGSVLSRCGYWMSWGKLEGRWVAHGAIFESIGGHSGDAA